MGYGMNQIKYRQDKKVSRLLREDIIGMQLEQ